MVPNVKGSYRNRTDWSAWISRVTSYAVTAMPSMGVRYVADLSFFPRECITRINPSHGRDAMTLSDSGSTLMLAYEDIMLPSFRCSSRVQAPM
jgi:hypothetical protein